MDTHLHIERSEHRGSSLVVARGEIDLSTAALLEEALRSALDDGLTIVDLTSVTFIDSTGLRALLAADAHAAEGITLIVAEGPVAKLLELTGSDQVFNVVTTRDEAVEPDEQA